MMIKLLIILSVVFFNFSMPAFSEPLRSTVLVKVNGLVCDFCAQSLEKVFKKKPEVANIDVNLTSKIVSIELEKDRTLSDEVIRKGIMDAGYAVVDIQR